MGTHGLGTRIGMALLSLGLFVSPIYLSAHPSGTALVDIYLSDDSLRLVADINGEDMLNAAWPEKSFHTISVSEYPQLHDRIGYYLKSNIMVTLNANRVDLVNVSSWYPGGGPGELMDSTQLNDTTYIIELKAPIQLMDAPLTVQSSLWARFGIEPITQVSIHYRDSLVHRKWILLEDKVSLNVHPDTLAAVLEARRAAGSDGGPPSSEIISRFIYLGFIHIIPEGMDHILFVLGLFFFSTALGPLLIQVTAFTIAHSITLALAVWGVFSLPGSIVEPLIALSIAVVGIENIFFRRMRAWRWLLVFGFGLIHGLGFAGVLKDLGLTQGNFLATLIGFNIGVELGQLAVIALAFVVTVWFWRKAWYFRSVVVPISALISIIGLYWAVERIFGAG